MTAPVQLALVTGPEDILAERAVDSVVEAVRAVEPEAEVVKLHAAGYQPGQLLVHASPSLFGGWSVIVVHDMDEADDPLVEDLLTYLARPADAVTLVVRHKSGNRGKKVLDAVRALRDELLSFNIGHGDYKAAGRMLAAALEHPDEPEGYTP